MNTCCDLSLYNSSYFKHSKYLEIAAQHCETAIQVGIWLDSLQDTVSQHS
jgi:hypothetical protein